MVAEARKPWRKPEVKAIEAGSAEKNTGILSDGPGLSKS